MGKKLEHWIHEATKIQGIKKRKYWKSLGGKNDDDYLGDKFWGSIIINNHWYFMWRIRNREESKITSNIQA